MRSEIAAIASTAYENGTMTSMGALLTSNNPQAVLSQASVLLQLSSARAAQVNEFVQAARQLQGAQLTAKRTEQGIATLDAQRLARKKSLGKSLSQKKALLATLTAQQQQAVTTTSTIGAGGSTTATEQRPDQQPGREGRRLRLLPAGRPVRVRGDRAELVRLLRAGPGGVGLRGGVDPADHVRAGGRAARGVHEQPAARRPAVHGR